MTSNSELARDAAASAAVDAVCAVADAVENNPPDLTEYMELDDSVDVSHDGIAMGIVSSFSSNEDDDDIEEAEEQDDEDDDEDDEDTKEEADTEEAIEIDVEEEEAEDSAEEIQDIDYDRRREDYFDEISFLENQFNDMKESLFTVRLELLDAKMEEVCNGRAREYLQPLAQLQENCRIRTQIAAILRGLRRECAHRRHDSAKLVSTQHHREERVEVEEVLRLQLQEQLRALREDRRNNAQDLQLERNASGTDSTRIRGCSATRRLLGTAGSNNNGSCGLRSGFSRFDPYCLESRRKPVSIAWPYVVYMLLEEEILEDHAILKKALGPRGFRPLESHSSTNSSSSSEESSDVPLSSVSVKSSTTLRTTTGPISTSHPVRLTQQHHPRQASSATRQQPSSLSVTGGKSYKAQYADGKLLYEGERFTRGHCIVVEKANKTPLRATVLNVTAQELQVRLQTGERARLPLTNLRRGAYCIRKLQQ